MTIVESTFKSRDITLLPKVHIVKAKVFPVVMYGCEYLAKTFLDSSVSVPVVAGCRSV